jgi:PST family polysaccharide transporter
VRTAVHEPDEAVLAADGGLGRRVLGGTGLTAAGFALSRSLTLVTYLVLARLAAPEVFGAFAAGTIIVGAGSMLVESGMLSALIQRRDRLEEALQTAFVATLVGGAAATLLALAVSPLVGLLFADRQIGLVAAASSGLLFLSAATVVPDAVLQRRFSFLRRVVVDPLGVAAFGVVAIASLAAGAGVWGLVFATYASEVVQIAAAWTASRFRPRPRLASFALWRELAGYGRHVLAGSMIDHVSLATNTFLLGRFLSPTALGQYRFAARFAILPQDLAVTAGSYVLLPALARVAAERERLERGVHRAYRLVVAAVAPASFLLLPLGPPLAVVLLGEDWRPAGVVLAILALASAPHAAGSVAAESLKAAGRPDVLPPLHLLGAVGSIVLMIALLPFGLAGVAAGVTIASVVADNVTVVRATRVLGFDGGAIVAAFWPPYVAGAVTAAVVFALEHLLVHADSHGIAAGLALIAAEALAGLGVYVACLLWLSPGAVEELRGARAFVRGRTQGAAA